MRLKRYCRRKKYAIIGLFVLILGIGYALISTTLRITGYGTFAANTWDVYFASITDNSNNSSVVEPATISDDKKSIDFSVRFQNPGDSYVFYTQIVNGGTIDAMLDSLEIEGLTDEVEKYLDLSIMYSDDTEISRYDMLKAESSDTIKIQCTYRDDLEDEDLIDTDTQLNVTVTIHYVQADDNAKER